MAHPIPRVAAVHDLSGFGRCSLTAAIPVLSSMGVQCCPLPTAVLSHQTGFDGYFCLDLTDAMSACLKQWEAQGARFDAVYTGFLGSARQAEAVGGFLSRVKNGGALTVVDPVLGDDGRLYPSITEDFILGMRGLVRFADVVLPNLTEAALLTGLDCAAMSDTGWLDEAAKRLSALGPQRVILTGDAKGGTVTNHAYDFTQSARFDVSARSDGVSYSGTGDVFASIVCGGLTRGDGLEASVRLAAAFIEKAARFTSKAGGDPREGIVFEKFLTDLS